MNAQAKATVAANAKYVQGVLVFTLPKTGAMVAAAVGGQKFYLRGHQVANDNA